MKAEELISHLNRTFGLNPWPETYEVDADTYANCCQFVFNQQRLNNGIGPNYTLHNVALGMTQSGLMFKNVELILRRQ